jgi:hypothetical protein
VRRICDMMVTYALYMTDMNCKESRVDLKLNVKH